MALPDLRERLHHLLEGEVEGETSKSARGKTKTVLLHIWAGGPSPLQPDALDLLRTVGARGNESRLALHWGMCLATYPFFSDVVSTCGRLLSVQNSVVLSQVTRRMTESWGELSTLTRAVQRVVRSMVDWGALCETKERGVFARTRPIDLSGSRALALWLLEAALVGGERPGSLPEGSLLRRRSIRSSSASESQMSHTRHVSK